MKIYIVCNLCTAIAQEDENSIASMVGYTVDYKIEGPLYFNTERKIQTQGYKCPNCSNQISVVVDCLEQL